MWLVNLIQLHVPFFTVFIFRVCISKNTVQLLYAQYEHFCLSAKESEDKENLPKRTSAGGFKFTFSHSASAANGANSTNSKSVAAQTSPTNSNGSSSKNANLTTAVTATKVRVKAKLLYPRKRRDMSCS